jgi:hypothetical protein
MTGLILKQGCDGSNREFGGHVKTSKITELTVETDEVFIIRKPRPRIQAWCTKCASEVEKITPEQSVALTSASWREIASRIEAGQLHFSKVSNGLLMICINSLSDEIGGRYV